ncbi:MAG TPA: sigma-70 family RNA polymerase sigma factor [Bryobacteraceae bacterium]|nr:sigma-70 family RNA polymerase sigma factor [Bryobacteraceae bacterium]HOL71972.1 sigma-70 family RNA polymerase sigma factor [Bryobacteraceae bacterium]HOQ44154.1 sigma-70 family RNA polymerase sigma factor [Bryobacteraceae bacterium]HPQ15673.1 sigma-70 family RNA polymerase sigma factor [Bryobacteraceae bacterium]HPU70472.1 sigma-70 family RNA polymerase sigma factor [Bryobacteraceae bacterium]
MSTTSCAATLSDERLIERVRAGEKAVYGVLMNRHSRRLHSVANRILQCQAEAEDAVQEAHLQVLARLDQFAGRSSFLTWLTRIVINEALMRLRARRPSVALDHPSPDGGASMVLISHSLDPEQEALRKELGRVLRSALKALPEKYRVVFCMREIDGIDLQTIAAKLNLSHECVKTRLYRARFLLRRRLRRRLKPARLPAGALRIHPAV